MIYIKVTPEKKPELLAKMVNSSYSWFNKTYIEINNKNISVLDYMNKCIHENHKNESENQINQIEKKYEDNTVFVYNDINNKIPIKEIQIEYEFNNLINDNKFTVENPNLYEVLAVIEKINLDNPKENRVDFLKKDKV